MVCPSFYAYSSELLIKPSIATSFVKYDVESGSFDQSGADSYVLEAGLDSSYASKKLNALFVFDAKSIDRHFINQQDQLTEENDSDNYLNYRFNTDLSIINNVLTIGAKGSQSYLNRVDAQWLVNDIFLGSDQLTKTRSHSAFVEFANPNKRYLGLDINGDISRIKSEHSADQDREIKNTNTRFQARLYQGNAISGFGWDIRSNYNDTNGTLGITNLRTRSIDASVFANIGKNLKLTLVGYTEDNQYSDLDGSALQVNEYTSYGVGLNWTPSNDKSIQLTYNSGEKDGEDDKDYVGLRLNWDFSPRTSISASLGRRFYGNSGSFSLAHRTRSFNARVNYSESVTNFSTIINGDLVLGTLVCPLGQASVIDCFIPDSSDYELQNGEEFLDITVQVPEVSEQVTLRKTWLASVGYTKRRFSASLSVSSTDVEYLQQSNRSQKTEQATLSTNLRIGTKTSINWNTSYNNVEAISEINTNETISSSLGLSHQLSPRLSTSLDYRYTDRTSSLEGRDLTDNRITFKVAYQY